MIQKHSITWKMEQGIKVFNKVGESGKMWEFFDYLYTSIKRTKSGSSHR
jgi:hypothetical protein